MKETFLSDAPALLSVQDLSVHYGGSGRALVPALEGASFELASGEVLGVLGESGCGKSTLALALLGLLPPAGRVAGGRAYFRGRNLLNLDEHQLEALRGDEISLVFQEPGMALHPCLRIGSQVADLLRVHRRWDGNRCRKEALAFLQAAGFGDAAEVFSAYPHQLSGGQQQRVVIAQALVCHPTLVIADEPTASLDTTAQAGIIGLLRRLKDHLGLSLIFISHNPALVASIADRVMVMYAGRIVEVGPRRRVYRHPLHPYTRELLLCAPHAPSDSGQERQPRLRVIPGTPPDLTDLPPGCPFEPRCPDRMAVCRRGYPGTVTIETERQVHCFKYGG